MVSRLEILGLLDLAEDGVDGTDEGGYVTPKGALPGNESYVRYDGDVAAEAELSGTPGSEPVLEWATWRRGEEGLLSREDDKPKARFGALLRSDNFRSVSCTKTLVSEDGKASSTGFRGVRMRLGDPEGLCVRN